MKFFDYKIIPTNEYKTAISNNVNYIKLHLGEQNSKDFLKFLAQEPDRLTVITKLREYASLANIDQEGVKTLRFATIVLYSCIHGDLESVCSTYDIDQGHLGEYKENHVYDVIKSEVLGAINLSD